MSAFAIRNKKKGLFLSIETVAVIVILTAIAAVVVAGAAHLFRTYKIYQISRDVAEYSEAIVQFKSVYKSYPGDLSVKSLTGSIYNATLSAQIGVSGGVSFPRGYIAHEAGSFFAFRELFVAKLISAPLDPDMTGYIPPAASASALGNNGNAVCDTLDKYQTNRAIPTAGVDDSIAWVATSQPTSGSIVTNASLVNYWGRNSVPVLVPVRPKNMAGATSACSAAFLADFANGGGSMSPVIAFGLDQKIDDGNPVTGRMIADNAQGYAGAASPCITSGVAAANVVSIANSATAFAVGTPGTAFTDLTALKYDSNSSDFACLPRFAVEGAQ